MRLSKVSSENFDEIIEIYKSKAQKDLNYITPKWAVFENSDKVRNPEFKIEPIDYHFINVDLKILVKKTEFYEVQINSLFTNNKLNDRRVSRILDNWSKGIFLDPPTVGVCNIDTNKLALSDGRHRTKTAFLLGAKVIPIAVHNTDFNKVNEILNN